jgi:hypothetical protein
MSFDSLSNLVFCCYNQRNPHFFILIAEILISECLYFAFRVYILAKVDFEKLITAKPLLIFFMLKNFLFIVNQIYRVYSKSNKYRKQKLIKKYKDFILAIGNYANNNQRGTANFQPQFMKENAPQYNPKFNVNGGFSCVPLSKNAVIAAAATGGQVPLSQAAQSQFYFNEEIAPNQNPYRFAQIYNDHPQVFTNGKAIANSMLGTPNPSQKVNNLSSACTAYINEHANNNSNIFPHYSHNNQNQVYHNNISSMNTLGSQQASSRGAISKHDHAANSALCQKKALHLSIQNNCVSKPGNKFYGLPIKTGNNSSSSGGNNAPDPNLNSASSSSLLKNNSSANMGSSNATGKHFRGG